LLEAVVAVVELVEVEAPEDLGLEHHYQLQQVMY
jgi:hypothetical protein